MRKELRKIQKEVLKYENLLLINPERAKENVNLYLEHLEDLLKFLANHLDNVVKVFEKWCKASVDVWAVQETNIFWRIENSIYKVIINHFLSTLSYEMAQVGRLQNKLMQIKTRFIQYKYLC